MVAIKLPVFAGMVPSVDAHLLSNQNASFAENTWLYSGALSGLPSNVLLRQLANPSAGAAFRIPGNPQNPSYIFESAWVEFDNPDTSFIHAPIAGDSFDRFYWAFPGGDPRYNTRARILANQPSWLLGIPQAGKPAVSVSGGVSATIVSRAYVATLVTEYGEEGPSSDPILINAKVDATFSVTLQGADAGDLGVNRNVKKINLYRTIVATSGTVTYYLVATKDALTTAQTFDDVSTDAVVASRPIMESTAWTAPPSDLEGMVVMPNGIIAGWRENELWFSEAYRPHAWPAVYSLSVEYNIVGLGVTNQTLVVCTEGHPMTASGVNPASITTSKLGSFEPCLSRGSILSTEQGVYYASPNGLIIVNPGVAENITAKVMSRDQWIEVTRKAPVRAARFGSAYFAYGAGLAKAFQDDLFQPGTVQMGSTEGARAGFLIDPFNDNVGVNYLASDKDVYNVMNDDWSGELFIIKDGKIYFMDQTPGYAIQPYQWNSKIYQTSDALNFAAFKVYFYEPVGFATPNPPNYDPNQVFDPDTQKAVVRIYADNRLVLTHELRVSGELHRIPSGFQAEFWRVELEAKVKIKSFQMATSVKELSNV